MPGLQGDASSSPDGDSTPTNPEDTKLCLPSSLPTSLCEKACVPGLAHTEDRLRFAQAMEALSGLCQHLQTRIMARKLSDKNATSQRAYVRSRSLQDQVEECIHRCYRQYNIARMALLALHGPGEWETKLRILKQEDVRGLSERAMIAEEKEEHQRSCCMASLPEMGSIDQYLNALVITFNPQLALGEGQCTLLWIWYLASEEKLRDDSPEVHASESIHCNSLI
jgi:hypothetical protein